MMQMQVFWKTSTKQHSHWKCTFYWPTVTGASAGCSRKMSPAYRGAFWCFLVLQEKAFIQIGSPGWRSYWDSKYGSLVGRMVGLPDINIDGIYWSTRQYHSPGYLESQVLCAYGEKLPTAFHVLLINLVAKLLSGTKHCLRMEWDLQPKPEFTALNLCCVAGRSKVKGVLTMAVYSASRSSVDLAIDPLIMCRLCLTECPSHEMYELHQCKCLYCKMVRLLETVNMVLT